MEVQIRVSGGADGGLVALSEWLNGEELLRGRVQAVRAPISASELGSIDQVLSVALEAGGAGTVLVSSLKTWLATRKTKAKLTIEAAGRSVTLDVETAGDVAPLLEQILKAGDDG